MGNVKKSLYDYYDRVVSIEGLQQVIDESDDVSQVQRFINYNMKPKFQSEKDMCNDFEKHISVVISCIFFIQNNFSELRTI